ncbi:hypothetical protein [Mycobacterium sp.]|uniref:hypothetical protein n=1 Tax=Mycobacterium sp. TaxID=1785 RepID=UPI003342B4F6
MSGVAISLTALSAGIVPALAEPLIETTTTEVVPTEEVVTEEVPTATEAPQLIPTTVAPQLPVVTQTTQAPVVTQTTQAPVVTQAPAIVTTTAAPEITTQPEAVTTTEAPDVTTTAPTTAATTVMTTAPTVPASSTATTTATSTSTGPSVALVPSTTAPSSSTSQSTEGNTSAQPSDPDTTAGGGTPEPSTGEEAAGVTKLAEPERLEAAPQDVKLAQQAVPVEENPKPAPQSEIDRLRSLVVPAADPVAGGATSVVADAGLAAANRPVLQWQPAWVQYDMYYRPLIFNPYPEPLQLVYQLAGVPRILLIPPLGRIVTEVRELGSYNFTALRLNAFGIPIDVAVGNFFGGGYFPGPGLPPPPPPPPVRTLTDVPVQVKYTNATYRPIRVQKIVDVGPDPAVGGEHKVLLDGVTPAWGEWKQTETGAQQFEVHKTQSFPGMEAPAEGPLPGDYDLQLVSDSSPTGLSGKDITLIVTAAIVAALGLGAIVLTIVLGRRRRPQH